MLFNLNYPFDDTVGAVAERLAVALRVAGSIPARNKYLYGLQIIVPGLAVCVCEIMLVNTPTIQEIFLVWGTVISKKN